MVMSMLETLMDCFLMGWENIYGQMEHSMRENGRRAK